MRPVYQQRFTADDGDCLPACLASILELPLSAVPNFCHINNGDQWWQLCQDWLVARGLYFVAVKLNSEGQMPLWPLPIGVDCIISGPSPRFEQLTHAVVGTTLHDADDNLRLQMVHDPHPDGLFLLGPPTELKFLAALDPVSVRCGNMPRPNATKPGVLRPNQQSCQRCGAVDGMNFHVPDDVWRKVAGPIWYNEEFDSVLCLACFDQLANEKGVKYADCITRVLFVGEQASFNLEPANPLDKSQYATANR